MLVLTKACTRQCVAMAINWCIVVVDTKLLYAVVVIIKHTSIYITIGNHMGFECDLGIIA